MARSPKSEGTAESKVEELTLGVIPEIRTKLMLNLANPAAAFTNRLRSRPHWLGRTEADSRQDSQFRASR